MKSIAVIVLGLLALIVALAASSPVRASYEAEIPNGMWTDSSPIPRSAFTTHDKVFPNAKPHHKHHRNHRHLKPDSIYRYQDFVGPLAELTLDPSQKTERDVENDKLYIAKVLRAPLDKGGRACSRKELIEQQESIRNTALRINHRRIALNQHNSWMINARSALKRLKAQIANTIDSSKNLARQLKFLGQQRKSLLAHSFRATELQEQELAADTYFNLKKNRVANEIRVQNKQDFYQRKNKQFNRITSNLKMLRTQKGRQVGSFVDDKPYGFMETGSQAQANAQVSNNEYGSVVEAESETPAEENEQIMI